jgi:hypothetical protein
MRKVDLYQIELGPYGEPADWQEFELTGDIVKMDTQTSAHMNFWAIEDSSVTPVTVRLRVFKTGEEIPATAIVRGSCWDPFQSVVMVHLVQDLSV